MTPETDARARQTEQRTDAAERSAHVLRGPQRDAAGSDPFVGPEFGPVKLRVVAELEARLAAAEAERDALRAAVEGDTAKHLRAWLARFPETPA